MATQKNQATPTRIRRVNLTPILAAVAKAHPALPPGTYVFGGDVLEVDPAALPEMKNAMKGSVPPDHFVIETDDSRPSLQDGHRYREEKAKVANAIGSREEIERQAAIAAEKVVEAEKALAAAKIRLTNAQGSVLVLQENEQRITKQVEKQIAALPYPVEALEAVAAGLDRKPEVVKVSGHAVAPGASGPIEDWRDRAERIAREKKTPAKTPGGDFAPTPVVEVS